MGAVSTEGTLLTDYRVVVDVKLAKEDGGCDLYSASYQVKFLGVWKELDYMISINQDIDEAAKELSKKACDKWNININQLQGEIRITK